MLRSFPVGTFAATAKSIKKHDGRYYLHLQLTDYNLRIKIDIHDFLLENVDCSVLTPKNLKRIQYGFPSTIEVSNKHGYWEIINEPFVLSKAISKIIC